MDRSNQSLTDIKLRIYLTALFWGGLVTLGVWFLNFKNQNANLVNSLFLPVIAIICLASVILLKRVGIRFLHQFERGIYAFVYLYYITFLINTAYNGMRTGVFLVQKFLLWLPMIYIMSFMMFSKNTALRLALSFVFALTVIGAMFLFLTRHSPFLSINFQVLFEILVSNLLYTLILYIIVLLKEMVHHGEVRATVIAELAYTDSLTGAFNRRKIGELVQGYLEQGRQFSVIMADVDHFKNINDTFGHDQGDLLLKDVADLLRGNLRHDDVVGRWGGDEFIVVCPNTTRKDTENIQARMNTINENPRLKASGCSLSFGIASSDEGESVEEIIKRADTNLYLHKRSKR